MRIAGTDIRIHSTFLILLAWYALMNYEMGGIESMIWGLVFILLLFTCVLLHELGHTTAAKRYGIHTPDITLLPIGGVARLERLPDKPVQEIIVALAGPAVNVAIACLLLLAMGGMLSISDFSSLETGGSSLLAKLFAANVILVAFNLIPAFPMDGGRVLRAVLAMYQHRARATVIAARIGQGIAVLAVVLGIAGYLKLNVILFLIAVFIFFAAQQEMQMALFQQMQDLCVGEVAGRFLALPFNLSIEAAAQEISRESLLEYPLVDSQLHLRGMVNRQEILKALRIAPRRALLEIGFQVPAVQAETPFREVFELMQRLRTTVLPVINPKGQVIGIVGLAQLSRLAKRGFGFTSHDSIKKP